MNQSNYRIKSGLLIVAFIIVGCQASQSASDSNITQAECEADASFIFIPGGEFIRGSDRTERDFAYKISAEAIDSTPKGIKQAEQKLRQTGWFDRESDRQTVSTSSYCIGRNLITNREYKEFVDATNHRIPGISAAEYQQQGFLVHPYTKVQEFLWENGTYPENTANHPVVLISYDDAMAYAAWRQQDATYRLPTATEWEKAARGEEGDYFPWGNEWQPKATNSGHSLNYTSPIATFPLSKSVYGVEDMAGNVFEYTSTLVSNDSRAVMKGCSWDDLPGFCRAAYQHTRPVDSRHILFGFRLVKE